MKLGFVGVGAISSAMVRGLLGGKDKNIEIILSPRSAHNVSALVQEFPNVQVAADNQQVVDESDIVVLGILPPQMEMVCAELTFRSDQIVISVVAGITPTKLETMVSPAHQVCQMIPLPVIALRKGPIVMCPHVPEVVELFTGLGELVVLDDESKIFILNCASASMSSFFQFQNTVVDWSIAQGLDPQLSKDYATALYNGLSAEAMHTPLAEIDHMPKEHETPGGLNEHIRRSLTDHGVFGQLTEALDYVFTQWGKKK